MRFSEKIWQQHLIASLKVLMILFLIVSCSDESEIDEPGNNEPTEPLEVVDLGLQSWADRPLRVKTFQNGDPILHATTPAEWEAAGNTQTPAWCYPDFDETKEDEGLYYNGYAVRDGRSLAPQGWIVPSLYDFQFLSGSMLWLELNNKITNSWQEALEKDFGYNFQNAERITSEGNFEGPLVDWWFWTSTPYSFNNSQQYPSPSKVGLRGLTPRPQPVGEGYKVWCIQPGRSDISDFTGKTWSLENIDLHPLPIDQFALPPPGPTLISKTLGFSSSGTLRSTYTYDWGNGSIITNEASGEFQDRDGVVGINIDIHGFDLDVDRPLAIIKDGVLYVYAATDRTFNGSILVYQ